MTSATSSPIKLSTDLIRSFYYLELDQSKQINSGVIIDDACYELMFIKEQNVKLIDGKNETFIIPPCYTLNNLQGPFRFKFAENFTTFCIKLQPWMNLSYVPTKKSQVLDLNKLYPEYMNTLHVKLFSSKSLKEMISHAEIFLLSLDVQMNERTALIKNICELIYEKSGNITVNEISETFNIYRQKLNAVFKEEVKYTLKNFINLIRIRACLNHKIHTPEVSLTEISYLFGYYDQAHFIRSFKKACGVTPSEYVKTPGYSFQAK